METLHEIIRILPGLLGDLTFENICYKLFINELIEPNNMQLRENYVHRLGEIELERSALLEEMEHIQMRLAALDREYTALKNVLVSDIPDRRWVGQGAPMLESIYWLLKEAKEPLHYKEINRRLRNQFFHIGGSAALSNIVVQLNRDKRFAKFERGVYGLAEWIVGQDSCSKSTGISSPTNNSTSKQPQALSLARERETERLRFVLQSIDVDIEVTKSNLKTIRNKLIGKEPDLPLPDGIDPKVALPTLEKRLLSLLEQRDELVHNLHRLLDGIKAKDASDAS